MTRSAVRTVATRLVLLASLAGGCRNVHGPAGSCERIDCSGHGRCGLVRGAPACVCDDGYRAAGLACVTPGVSGDAEAPPPAPATAPGPAAAAPASPPSATSPGWALEPEAVELCSRALEALASPADEPSASLVASAKRDAIARERPALLDACTAFLRDTALDAGPIGCGIALLARARAAERNAAEIDPAAPDAAECGTQWRRALAGRWEAFREFQALQREQFGVAVFGLEPLQPVGDANEELCRRFLAAGPLPPGTATEAAGGPPSPVGLEACRARAGAFGLRPLLRWCLADRAGEVRAAEGAGPCERYADPEELEPLRRATEALRALPVER